MNSFLKREQYNIPQKSEIDLEKNKSRIIERKCLILNSLNNEEKIIINNIKESGQFVNFKEKVDILNERGFKNSGYETYVISRINKSNMYSEGYYNCTGIIMVGESKKEKKPLSFMSHQDTRIFFEGNDVNEKFKKDLSSIIHEFKNEVNTESIDVIIFGGKISTNKDTGRKDKAEYINSIKYLSNIITKELSIKPRIATGPNKTPLSGPTNIYFDIANRLLYVVRPIQENEVNESFVFDDLENQSSKW